MASRHMRAVRLFGNATAIHHCRIPSTPTKRTTARPNNRQDNKWRHSRHKSTDRPTDACASGRYPQPNETIRAESASGIS
jgi:hypothetical protein